MNIVEIKSNKDLINFLSELKVSTSHYLNTSDELFNSLPKYSVYLLRDLEINETIAKKISSMLKYFSGTFEGNNHTLTISSSKVISLFSSVYYAKISNLIIHNVKGSRGLMLGHDGLEVEVNNVKVTGHLTLQESIGSLFKTTMHVKYNHCSVALTTKSVAKAKILTDDDSPYIFFGGFSGTDLGETVYNHCKISGNINSEVMVGGFVGISKGSKFTRCSVDNLEIIGIREVGAFAGRVDKEIIIEASHIANSKVTANIYSGFVAGRCEGSIKAKESYIDDSFISSNTASSFIGGVAGTAAHIELTDCHFKGSIYGNFVIAGICPDACETHIEDSTFDIEVIASGYKPMMTHAYELVREEYLTTRGKEPSLTLVDSDVNIRVVELELSGLINPFKEAII